MVDVDGGHVEAAAVRTVRALATHVVALLVLVLVVGVALGLDGQDVIVDVEVDVVFVESGQIGFQYELAVILFDGSGPSDVEGRERLPEHALLKFIDCAERVVASDFSTHDFGPFQSSGYFGVSHI